MRHQPNIKRLRKHAKQLRREHTDAERLLWHHLRARRLQGLKFQRQKPIGNYIVDFVCHEKMLIVELDGGQHAFARKYDAKRTAYLNSQGYKVIRFWNNVVLADLTIVLEHILTMSANAS